MDRNGFGTEYIRRKNIPIKNGIESSIKKDELKDSEEEYLRYHEKRISFNAKVLIDLVKKDKKDKTRILDIGPHFQTQIFSNLLGDEATINTMGWLNESLVSKSEIENHFELDLNTVEDRGTWPNAKPHDVVIVTEVVEHLHIPLFSVVRFIERLLAKDGYLIVQTPNAANLKNRMKMFLGKSPFELVKEENYNEGHFREYTKDELCECIEEYGLEVEEEIYCDYWPETGVRRMLELIFPSLRRGITIIARK